MPPSETYPAWRDGTLLVLPREAPVAPNRCVLTNEAVFEASKISRQLSWGDEGPLKWLPQNVRILLALANMKVFTVTFGLSAGARSRRHIGLIVSVVCLLVGFFFLKQGFRVDGAPISMMGVVAGAALIVVSLTLFSYSFFTIDIVAVDAEYIWLRGARQTFLDSLPPLERAQAPNQPPQPIPPRRDG